MNEAIPSMLEDIEEFHTKFGLAPHTSFEEMPQDLREFRAKFIKEEAREIIKAAEEGDRENELDGYIDLAYVALGSYYLGGKNKANLDLKLSYTAITMNQIKSYTLMSDSGLAKMLFEQPDIFIVITDIVVMEAWQKNMQFMAGWHRVHQANMAKVRAKSKDESKRGSTYDVVKPDGWVAPTMEGLV